MEASLAAAHRIGRILARHGSSSRAVPSSANLWGRATTCKTKALTTDERHPADRSLRSVVAGEASQTLLEQTWPWLAPPAQTATRTDEISPTSLLPRDPRERFACPAG